MSKAELKTGSKAERDQSAGRFSEKTVTVIGAGKMGGVLVDALVGAGVSVEKIRITVKHGDRINRLTEQLGLQALTDNVAAVSGADIVLLCVKPQHAAEVLAEVAPSLSAGTLLISIATALSTEWIESALKAPIAVVRAMPNTAARIGKGMTVLCRGRYASEESIAVAESLFGLMGRTAEVDELHMDAVTGLSGSGPAFIYMILEALAEGGVRVGLPRDVATMLAAQATLGAAAMVLQTGQHPAVLKNEVTTPGGCTVDGLLELEDGKIRATLIRAIAITAQKAGQLSPKPLAADRTSHS